jgi:hypothetical protein
MRKKRFLTCVDVKVAIISTTRIFLLCGSQTLLIYKKYNKGGQTRKTNGFGADQNPRNKNI